MGNVEIEIEELVLHGFRPGDRHRIGEALERELTRLLTDKGLPQLYYTHIDRLDGGSISLAPNTKAEVTGAQIARAVYGRLSDNAVGRSDKR